MPRHHGSRRMVVLFQVPKFTSYLSSLQRLPLGWLSGHQKCAGKSAGAAQLEGPEILVPIALGNVGIFCPVAEVHPLLPREAFPLNLRHSSTAENQCPELVNQLILPTRIVVREVRFELPEELSLAVLLPLETKAHKSGDRLAHTCIRGSRVSGNLVGNSGR